MNKKSVLIIVSIIGILILVIFGFFLFKASSNDYSSSSESSCKESVKGPTFVFPSGSNIKGSDYYNYKGCIFLGGNIFEIGTHKLEGSDVKSFQILSGGYSKDKNRVYYLGNILLDADPVTFIVKTEDSAIDKNQVYYMGKKLNDADPNSFFVIQQNGKNTEYSKDKNNVYYEDLRLNGSDPDSFVILPFEGKNTYYAKDKNQVYYMGQKILYANPQSFTILNGSYSRDNQSVFFNEYRYSYLKSFIVLNSENPEEFIVGNTYYNFSKFGDVSFYRGLRVSDKIDTHNFEWIGGNYYRSAYLDNPEVTMIFFEDKLVIGADVKSFKVTTSLTAKDVSACYLEEKRVTCS
jgi:hypothetical protein